MCVSVCGLGTGSVGEENKNASASSSQDLSNDLRLEIFIDALSHN